MHPFIFIYWSGYLFLLRVAFAHIPLCVTAMVKWPQLSCNHYLPLLVLHSHIISIQSFSFYICFPTVHALTIIKRLMGLMAIRQKVAWAPCGLNKYHANIKLFGLTYILLKTVSAKYYPKTHIKDIFLCLLIWINFFKKIWWIKTADIVIMTKWALPGKLLAPFFNIYS